MSILPNKLWSGTNILGQLTRALHFKKGQAAPHLRLIPLSPSGNDYDCTIVHVMTLIVNDTISL